MQSERCNCILRYISEKSRFRTNPPAESCMFFRVCCKSVDSAEKLPSFPKFQSVSRVIFHIYKRNSLWYHEYDEQYHTIFKEKGAFIHAKLCDYNYTAVRQQRAGHRHCYGKKAGHSPIRQKCTGKRGRGDRQHPALSGGVQQKRHEFLRLL